MQITSMYHFDLLPPKGYLPVIFILVKMLIIFKYFIFMKYRTSAWKAVHFIYFPTAHIGMQEYDNSRKIKRLQNHLTMLFIASNLALIYIKGLV